MTSLKRSISDINLDKNLSRSSSDILTTVIREESTERSNVYSEQMVLTLTSTVYTTGFGDDSKINIKAILHKEARKWKDKDVEKVWNNVKRFIISMGIRDFK